MANSDGALAGEEAVEWGGLAALCTRYRAPLVRYFLRRRYSVDIAEDCAQDVFVRMARADLTAVENIESYLFSVASSVAVDHGRRMRSRHAAEHEPIDNFSLESRESSPSCVLEGKEALLQLDSILDELRPRTREIFLLNRLDGLSCTQLAARFGMSVAAVEKQMSRALAHIRKRLPRDE